MLPARLRQFLAHESAGGLVMMACALVAMVVANSPWAELYHQFLHSHVGGVAVEFVINDILMAIFFLLVGMELKREMMEGFLAQRSQKILPLIAALGGIITPALIYLGATRSLPVYQAGWAIPTATDIAFAMCVLSMCGRHVPPAAKIFLLAIAIYDDLAAIMIIALFCSHGVVLLSLAAAGVMIFLMVALNRRGIVSVPLYLLLGGVLWYFVHDAGIHSTVAGMVTGLLIPMRVHGKNSPSPLNRFLHRLHPYVAFGILPLFAFANAGVSLQNMGAALFVLALPLGIAMGLFLGKPLGIFSATYASVRLNFADKPAGISWLMLYGVSILAGIGFTMSLFIGLLAFHDDALRHSITLGVITGSLLSSILGVVVIRLALARA